MNGSENKEEFNPVRLYEAFTNSLKKSDQSLPDFDDISLNEYILAYEEIVKFLECLGSVFYFVIVDVRDKINILRDYLKKHPEQYETIYTLVVHEQKLNYFKNPIAAKQSSATRHILRLHRALIFVCKFLDQLIKAEQRTKSAQICTEAYEATLAKHHSWLVRKAAVFGMLALPKREVLVGYMCKNTNDLEKFPVFIQTVEKTYNITQAIYEKFQITDLP